MQSAPEKSGAFSFLGIGDAVDDAGHRLLQGIQDLVWSVSLAKAQQHGVVSGEGSQDGIRGVLVQVGGYGGSVALFRADNGQRKGDFYPYDTMDYRGGRRTGGQGGLVPLARAFSDIQCLEVSRQRGLRDGNAALFHFLNQFFLAEEALGTHNVQQDRLAGFDVLHSFVNFRHEDSE